MTHTPGPWHIEQLAAGRYRILANQGPITVSPAAVHGEPDARLIAAAPDLLEALENIVDCYGMGATPEQFCKNVAEFIDEGRTAIAKATGE